MENNKYLEGNKVYLRSLNESDFGQIMQKWLNDKEVTYFLSRGSKPGNLQELSQEFKNYAFNRDEVVLAICDVATDEYIGITGLHSINQISHHAEFRILVGSKAHWGQGFGAEATELIIAYGFQILNLQKVWLGVNAENKKAHDSYLRRGFRVEGLLRKELFRNGRYYDVVRMSLLQPEYMETLKQWKTKEKIQKQLGAF